MNNKQVEELRQFGQSIGIPAMGFCCALAGKETAHLKEWMGQGFSAGMEYFRKTVGTRSMEEELLQGQRSIILCLFPYPAYLKSPHISSYALFLDYHIYLNRKLRELDNFLKEKVPGAETRVFADTSPVMEKPLAARAGLGFQGKNTLLIHPKYGSYCFLGGLVTDAAIEDADAAPPVADGCGDCRVCLDACPVQALSDKGLDARKCLSYHNVENRKDVPEEIQDKMGVHVFGCGLCEEVCPRNKNAKPGRVDDWKKNPDLARFTLKEIHDGCSQGFKKMFADTPVYRLGKKGFLRNLLIAMGNSGQKEYIYYAEKHLADPFLKSYADRSIKKLEQLS